MRRTVVASFLDAADVRRALSELAASGISAAAVELEHERDVPAAQMTKQRQEAEELVVGPGIVVPGPSGRAAVAGAIWGSIAGAIAGIIAGAIASGGEIGITIIIALVCGATSGAVFGGFWAGAARADEEAEKDEMIEKRSTAVSVPVADRAEAIRALRALKELNPDHIGVVDENGIPLDDESDEALWVREA
jgi:hypothetical protein